MPLQLRQPPVENRDVLAYMPARRAALESLAGQFPPLRRPMRSIAPTTWSLSQWVDAAGLGDAGGGGGPDRAA